MTYKRVTNTPAEREVFKEFKVAREAAAKLAREDPKRIYFVMSKGGFHTVVTGWDGRDEALKEGWSF